MCEPSQSRLKWRDKFLAEKRYRLANSAVFQLITFLFVCIFRRDSVSSDDKRARSYKTLVERAPGADDY